MGGGGIAVDYGPGKGVCLMLRTFMVRIFPDRKCVAE